MSMSRTAALQIALLLAATFANAVAKNAIRIKVLDSETRSVSFGDNSVPNNCEQVTFDAYCRSSRTPQMTSTLLVQEGDAPPFRIACTIESRFSRCAPLPVGTTYDARREKHGITVFFVDDNGKTRKQLYTLVASDAKLAPAAPAAATSSAPAPQPAVLVPVQSAPVPAPAASVPPPGPSASAQHSIPEKPGNPENPEKVRCSFSSTPPGAEITLDGKYVGNTPSEIAVTTGAHAVVFSLPGFAEWKRDLTVLPASALTVSAILQKQPQ
jgi:hypothetical protein